MFKNLRIAMQLGLGFGTVLILDVPGLVCRVAGSERRRPPRIAPALAN